jgi:hypothetical protein
MSKRCQAHARRDRDLYLTPAEAVLPLKPHLPPACSFIEPCAADGTLVAHLEAFGHRSAGAFDIVPLAPHVRYADALSIDLLELGLDADFFITNSPWLRPLLHAIIENLSAQRPTWLLFDADWKHTKQAKRFLPHCGRIVSVGRVRWISETKNTGKDNAAWYLFAPGIGPPVFYGRGQPAAPAMPRRLTPLPHLHREPAQ